MGNPLRIAQPPVAIVGLLLMGTLLSLLLLALAPFSAPLPVHLELTRQIAQGSSIADTTYPIGYPAFLALPLRCAGLPGIFLAQTAVYLFILILSYRILRLTGVKQKVALLSCTVISLHPYLLLNIKRIVDSNLATLLYLAFISVLLQIKRRGLTWKSAILSGLLFGYMILVRQNSFFLLPLVPFTLFYRKKPQVRKLLLLVVALLTTLVTIAAVTVPLKGRFCLFQADYAAYNLYAGANPYTYRELIRNYDAEYSISDALAEHGLPYPGFGKPHPDYTALYLRFAREYILQQPLEYIVLAGLKVLTLFRPDYRRVQAKETAPPLAVGLVQTFLMLPWGVWVFTRWRFRRFIGFLEGPMIAPLVLLYVVPFALSNVDPRFRWPLDVLMILDTAYGWSRWRELKQRCILR